MDKTSYNLVIINGWGASNAVFKPLIETLGDMSPLQKTITLSLYEAIRHEDSIHNAFDRLSDHPCFLLCWSCGTLPALEYASKTSKMLKGIIVISGTARFSDNTGVERWHENLVQQMADNLLMYPQSVLDSFSKKCLSKADTSNTPLCSWFIRQFKNSTPQALYSSLIYIKNVNMTENLYKITVPVCMISGQKDRICKVSAMQYIEDNVKSSSTHILKNTGHAPHVFHSAKCADFITHFIQNQFSQ